MTRGKHRAAAQRRYDRTADEQIEALRQEVITANRARRDAEERAAQADALRAKLDETTADRDTATGPEVRRLNAMVVDLQERLREADKTNDLRWDQISALKEKIWPFIPGRVEEKLEWIFDVIPGKDQWSTVAGRTIHDPRIVARKGQTDTHYQYLMQRIQGRRTSLDRPLHTIEARMVDARNRAELAEPDFPQTAQDINWLSEELHNTRNFLRDLRDLLLVGETTEAVARLLDMLSKTPPAQTHTTTSRSEKRRTLDGRTPNHAP